MILHTLELRRYLIARIIERGGAASVANLVDDLADAGFEVAGRPSKTVSDVLLLKGPYILNVDFTQALRVSLPYSKNLHVCAPAELPCITLHRAVM